MNIYIKVYIFKYTIFFKYLKDCINCMIEYYIYILKYKLIFIYILFL